MPVFRSSQALRLLVPLLAVALLSCPKPAAPTPNAPSASTVSPAISETVAKTEKPAASETGTGTSTGTGTALPMKAVASEEVAKPVKTAPASSLGGQDRHLVTRPFDSVHASDFELGILSSPPLQQGLSEVLGVLASDLMQGTLPLDIFEEGMAAVSRLLYLEALVQAPRIDEIRFQKPATEPGGVISVALRLISRHGGVRHTGLGLVLLSQAETGVWRIEHLELDLGALEMATATDEGAWDPYSQSFSSSQRN